MLTEPRPQVLDLLVIGGLTVDRFADSSSAPGGSVLHISRAAARRDLRIGVVTAAGPEAEARSGLDELRRLARLVEVVNHPASTTFRHHEADAGRRLWLERAGGPVSLGMELRDRVEARAVLYAPVSGEIGVDAMLASEATPRRGAILQGLLRSVHEAAYVEPLQLSVIPRPIVEAMLAFDLLVASREDLIADAHDPSMQLLAMRETFGGHPLLVVTDGRDGAWLDSGSGPEHFQTMWRLEGASTIGAGDILAAHTLLGLDRTRATGRSALRAAMLIVEEVLKARGGRPASR